MKKIILAAISELVFVNANAYTAQIENQSSLDISVKSAGNVVCSIPAKNTKSCTLDAYTAYQVTYPGKWADQGLFTLQKYSYQVLQITPVQSNPALTEFLVDYQATGSNNYAGTIRSFQNSDGSFDYAGNCNPDSGGVTCQLSAGEDLNQLNIKLISK